MKEKGLLLKLDLEKAFDYTNWDFLDYLMARRASVRNVESGYMNPLLHHTSQLC